jgi:2-methylcitrate dehydratase PrpD
MTTVRRLAEFVVGFTSEELSDGAREAALRCLLDLFTAAVAGFGTPDGSAARTVACRLYAPGESTIWFTRQRHQVAGAALANSAMASALDLDDGHRAASGHPGAAVIPAALAVAEETGAEAPELLAAIALGYEVGVRIAAARDFTALGAFSTGRWCGYGVAAGAGWLRRLSPDRLAHALAVSGVSAPNQFAAGTSGYSRLTGNSVKEGIPWATVTGLTAVSLAEAGYTGPEDILDHLPHYDAARILDGLGQGFLIERTYFKPYSACRWAHAAIDGVGAIMEAQGLTAGDLLSIEIHTFDRALRLKNSRDPATLLDAQYSVPYCVALRAVAGPDALLPLTQEALGRPEAVAMAEKVSLRLDPALDRRFPAATPARVVVLTATGRYEQLVEAPKGEPSNPLSWEALRHKFRTVARDRMPPDGQERLLAAVEALKGGRTTPLLEALRTPIPPLRTGG